MCTSINMRGQNLAVVLVAWLLGATAFSTNRVSRQVDGDLDLDDPSNTTSSGLDASTLVTPGGPVDGCMPPLLGLNGSEIQRPETDSRMRNDYTRIREVKFSGAIGPLGEKRLCKIKCIDGHWVGPLCVNQQDGGRFHPLFRSCHLEHINAHVMVTFRNVSINIKNEESIFKKFYKVSKEESSRGFLEFMINADEQANPFVHHKADCGVEMMFVSVDLLYRKMSLAEQAGKASLELIKQMSKGINVKIAVDNQHLTLDHIPKFAFGMCTTFKTRNIVRNLGFSSLKDVSYDNCFYKGQSYGSKIGHLTKFYSMDSLQLS